MKKMMHMIFSFSLSFLIFASNICLAARPMTEQESVQFTTGIKTYFSNNFIIRINLLEFFKDCPANDRLANKFDLEKIEKFVKSFVSNNDKFDEEQGLLFLDISNLIFCKFTSKLKSFKEAITLYHDHISNGLEFLKQPLCCRALSAYILHQLIEMGIECKYVKFTISGNEGDRDKEDHDVVAYKVEDEWYVCDLMFALISEMLRNCCKNPQISLEKIKSDPLKMPIDEYKEGMNPGDTWDETDVTPEILDLDWQIVSNHNITFSTLKEILKAQQKQQKQ